MLLPGVLEGVPDQLDHDIQDQGIFCGQPRTHHPGVGTRICTEGVGADLGTKNQEESAANF